MAWNPNKPPLEYRDVNNEARKFELAQAVPKYDGFPQAPLAKKQPVPASNTPPNTRQESKELAEKKVEINRAEQRRRTDDNVVNMSVGLLDIDTAILNYMQNDLNIQIKDNGGIIPVPIIYASPERWKAALKDGYLRTKQGQLQNPIIAIRRSGFSRNDELMTFNRHVSETFVRKYSPKNNYDQFSHMNNTMWPVHEVYHVTCPDFILVNYECIIWTDLVEQMNTIIERINFAVEEYWGDKHRLNFRVRIADWSNTVEVEADDDRLVRSDCVLEVWAHLLPETFEDFRLTTQKALTPRKIVFGMETSISDRELWELTHGKADSPQRYENTNIDDASLKNSLFTYQSTQNTVYGTWISTNGSQTVIQFNNTSLLPTPDSLKNAISELNKFAIFIDGSSVSYLNIVSFIQEGVNFIVTLNNYPNEVNQTSEIFTVGKFS